MRKFLAVAALAAGLIPSTSAAAIVDIFGGDVPCTLQVGGANDGERHCVGIFNTFDGAPIDVNVGFPPEPAGGADGDFPIVGVFHGWGGTKLSLTGGSMQQWLDKGYAVFSMSDRGWGNSCGSSDPKRLQPGVCDNGYNHLMDTRYEVRDAQEVFEALADQAADGAMAGEGLIDPLAIASMGSSYGGGISYALAVLKDRKMIGGGQGPPTMPEDGTLVPWVSPGGKAMQIAAAQPDIPWSDLAYSLQPNGHTLDYVEYAPYLQRGRVGIMKQSFVSGFYAIGQALSNYAPTGSDPDADLNTWYSLVSAGEPYDENPLAQDIIDELTRHHSAYYIDDSVAPAPMLISNGWTDDIFPADEALRFYNKTRTRHPGTPISLIFTDHGHQRGQNKGPDSTWRNGQLHAWFDYYVRGIGSPPFDGVQTLTQTCSGPSGGATGDFDDPGTDLPFQAATWDALAPGEFRIESAAAQVIATDVPSDGPVGQAFDPIAGPGACATADAADQAGAATYRSDPMPAGGFTLMGSPTIVADILSAGPTSQVAARLLDVSPAGDEQTLVARGLYRPLTNTSAVCQVFQLHPNGWKFEEGHVVKLELLPADQPYGRDSNGQAPITVENLTLRLPAIEAPGGIVQAPSDKVLPPGYVLASDVTVGVDTSCVVPSTTTTTSTTTTLGGITTTSTMGPTTTTSTTTTTLPGSSGLTLTGAVVRSERSPGASNGGIRLKGAFVQPPLFSTPPAFAVRVRDVAMLDRLHSFDSCTTRGNSKIVCRDSVGEERYKAIIKPFPRNASALKFKISFSKQPIAVGLDAPIEMTLLHNSAVVRFDQITLCREKSNKVRCKE